jgi:hypothetical protein
MFVEQAKAAKTQITIELTFLWIVTTRLLSLV